MWMCGCTSTSYAHERQQAKQLLSWQRREVKTQFNAILSYVAPSLAWQVVPDEAPSVDELVPTGQSCQENRGGLVSATLQGWLIVASNKWRGKGQEGGRTPSHQ